MNKKVMCMLTAGVMAASTVLSAVPAFADETEDGYAVLINIPYDVYYAAQDANIEVDAITSATAKVNSTSLSNGCYADADNNIKGVTIPAWVESLSGLTGKQITSEDRLDVTWTARGKEQSDTLEGAEVLVKSDDYAYYVLSDEEVADVQYGYNLTVSGGSYTLTPAFDKTTESTTSATILDGYQGGHTDYTVKLGSNKVVQDEDTVYGLTLNASNGKSYGLRGISGIWRETEYGFDVESFSDLIGNDIVSVTAYTDKGVYKMTLDNALNVRETLSAVVYSEEENAIYVKDILPADAQNVKVTVTSGSRKDKVTYVENGALVDGKVVLTDGKLAKDVVYTVSISCDNYATVNYEFSWPMAEPIAPVTTGAGAGRTSSASKAAHHHTYAWETTTAATATTDGVMKYRCTGCGTVEYEVPISAYYVFNKDTQEAIQKAAANATVKVETPVFISFHEMVKDALDARQDVTLVVDYKNNGKSYEMTIPAGSASTLDQLYGESQYAGFLYLGGAFETVEQ